MTQPCNTGEAALPTQRVLGSDAAVAVGRFAADGPYGYRAKSGGPIRATREEAVADYFAFLTHCGHEAAQFVTSSEGTSYCPACELAASVGSTS